MYKTITTEEKMKMDVFDGDLEGYLLNLGVSKHHIDKMKNKILTKEKSLYYKIPNTEEHIDLVPVEKIIWTTRSTDGWSVYENVNKMKKGDREPSRFIDCFEHKGEKTIDEFRNTFANNIKPVALNYLVEDDLYCGCGEGNHRTLIAMLIDAKEIKAKVSDCHIDLKTRRKYYLTKNFYEKYNIKDIRESISGKSKYTIYFKDDNGRTFRIVGYNPYYESSDLEGYLLQLGKQIETDFQCARFIKKIPAFLQLFILKVFDNGRIGQILYYWNDNEYCLKMHRFERPVHLYNIYEGDIL